MTDGFLYQNQKWGPAVRAALGVDSEGEKVSKTMQQGTWRDPYLDKVQEAAEQFPTWDEAEILVYVFEKAMKQHPADFILEIREGMRKAEAQPPRHSFENRNA